MPLAIDHGFLKDLGKLEELVYNPVTEVFDEFDAATHPGLHLGKIANARNLLFQSILFDHVCQLYLRVGATHRPRLPTSRPGCR
ncbi:hypothetical protein B1987_18685 [Mycobacterium kansasii]|uniref:Uncharacterized protein n=1 Tax=Mycobacterium attenuatum TaxID=2341086 RepID=A0A498PYL8_9MYCO|nr:hypothetical protein B1987_18685 [Mycobacterium kansasii]VBA38756.1 hypothetical protein LAUMK136_02634 [Mycobacterium attenuatum]VBA52994.1 hypothetical protein LAUMK191_02633 [Mycobacterium attenuatum]